MKMKHLLLIGIFILLSKSNYSQLTNLNKYFFSFYNVTESNFDLTKSLLERFTNATSIDYNKTDNLFTVLTPLVLNKQTVTGKMLKNYLPVKFMVLEGEPVDPFPSFVNTGNQEEDGKTYDEQKTNWIKKYPLEYKKMTDALKK